MKIEDIDMDRLREDLAEEIEAASRSDFPGNVTSKFDPNRADDEEVVSAAIGLFGKNIEDYAKDRYLK
jgi:hypothetical protein